MEPAKSTYRCRLCYKYFNEFGLQQRYKSVFADESGTLKKYKHDNKKAMIEHANIPGHKTIVQILQERSSKRLIFSTFIFLHIYQYIMSSVYNCLLIRFFFCLL